MAETVNMGSLELMSQSEKALHEKFMREALAMAEYALKTDETPVGCVLVHNGQIIARGMNATNCSLNGTRHAEFIAVNQILSPSLSLSSRSQNQPSFQDRMSVFRETDLYVTIEPCIMCASFLRQIGIRKVYFGGVNDRFGGTGGVLNIHSLKYDVEGDNGYEVSEGWLREEAIMVLRRFYVQENEKAPEPKNKKDRQLNTEIAPLSMT